MQYGADRIDMICKKHGELNKDQFRRNTKNRLICKQCQNEHAKQNKIKHKDKLNTKALMLRDLASKNLLKKVCRVHGELLSSDIYVNNKAVKNCKLCIQFKRKEFYIKNKSLSEPSQKSVRSELKKKGACSKHGENMRNKSGLCRKCSALASHNWKKRNPEKAKEFTETMLERYKSPERIERRKNQEKLRRINLTDYYVKSILKNQSNLPITMEIINMKKVIIQIKRLIKEERDGY